MTTQTILGNDFISPEEIAKARGVTYSDKQLATFGSTLPSQETLEWCRNNGMMLVAGPPKAMSLLDIRALDTTYFYCKEDGWYADKTQKFAANDKAGSVWIALRKEPVPNSLNRNWSEQNEPVTDPMSVPNIAETVWGLTTYKAVRGVYLLPNFYVRTSSVGSDDHPVIVGIFNADGLNIYFNWGDYRYDVVGLASSRKFD